MPSRHALAGPVHGVLTEAQSDRAANACLVAVGGGVRQSQAVDRDTKETAQQSTAPHLQASLSASAQNCLADSVASASGGGGVHAVTKSCVSAPVSVEQPVSHSMTKWVKFQWPPRAAGQHRLACSNRERVKGSVLSSSSHPVQSSNHSAGWRKGLSSNDNSSCRHGILSAAPL